MPCREKLEASPPLLPEGVQNGDPAWDRVRIKYVANGALLSSRTCELDRAARDLARHALDNFESVMDSRREHLTPCPDEKGCAPVWPLAAARLLLHAAPHPLARIPASTTCLRFSHPGYELLRYVSHVHALPGGPPDLLLVDDLHALAGGWALAALPSPSWRALGVEGAWGAGALGRRHGVWLDSTAAFAAACCSCCSWSGWAQRLAS